MTEPQPSVSGPFELAPSYVFSYFCVADTRVRSGKPQEAIWFVDKTERLDPRSRVWFETVRGEAYVAMGRYADAIPVFKAFLVLHPDGAWEHVWLAIAYSELGREQEARGEAAEVLRISPHFSLKAEKERLALRDQTLEERYLNDLRKAGLK